METNPPPSLLDDFAPIIYNHCPSQHYLRSFGENNMPQASQPEEQN
jgi:hypothetical protein